MRRVEFEYSVSRERLQIRLYETKTYGTYANGHYRLDFFKDMLVLLNRVFVLNFFKKAKSPWLYKSIELRYSDIGYFRFEDLPTSNTIGFDKVDLPLVYDALIKYFNK